MGRFLIAVGLAIALLGLIVLAVETLGIPLGRLPGDMTLRGKNTTVYFPWVTCLLLSAVGSLVLWLLSRRG